MRTALGVAMCLGILCGVALGFDDKELFPVKPGVQHMWHYDDGGAHVCIFKYKFVSPDKERLLEELFPGLEFYVVAVWNENGKQNLAFDGATHTFRFYSSKSDKKVYGNLDPFDSMAQQINSRLEGLNRERSNVDTMLNRLRTSGKDRYIKQGDAYVRTDEIFADEIGQWAKSRKLTTNQALTAYGVKLDGGISTLKNLLAVAKPFTCAVGEKCWSLVPLRPAKKSAAVDAAIYIKPGGEVEMTRVGLTKPMITKLELKQRN